MHKLELMLNMVATDAGIERSKFAYSAAGSQADESDRYYVRGDIPYGCDKTSKETVFISGEIIRFSSDTCIPW